MLVEVNGKHISVTISIGVSQYDGGELPDETVNRADAALYTAKNGGRNQVGFAAKPGVA